MTSGIPDAAMVKFTLSPVTAVTLLGCVVKKGASAVVNTATLLVTLPKALLAITWNWSPFMSTVVLLTVKLAVVEPLYVALSVKFAQTLPPLGRRCHW